jgi:hypothetical protein
MAGQLLHQGMESAMKLSVIALDHDGTIARADVLDPSVREAIAEARTSGIIVLLVTGRILDDLRRVAGDLHFVDGVIAENGAVLHFPGVSGLLSWRPLYPMALSRNCDVAEFPSTRGGASSMRMRPIRPACWTSFAPSSCRSSSTSTVGE